MLLLPPDAKLGVFHQRADEGQYKLTYAGAQQACAAHGGTMATYSQLSYAQQVSEHNTGGRRPEGCHVTGRGCVQGGLNMCAAGWLHQARVAYPTTFSNPLCGFGHVGIVDYGIRRNLSETWDAFCYRMKGEQPCTCTCALL